jgi:RNA polymerase sigma-70 factor (ECF subfamily)
MRKKQTPIPLSRGNREFFRDFYERYKHFLLYIAGFYTDKRSEREDLVQEALLRLMKNGDTLRELTHEQTVKYIELTVKTVYLDQEQKRCKAKLLSLDEAALEALVTEGPQAESGMLIEELRCGMSNRDWLALEGKYILGYSHEELGQLLGMNADSMRSMVSRARKRAKKLLDEMDKEER